MGGIYTQSALLQLTGSKAPPGPRKYAQWPERSQWCTNEDYMCMDLRLTPWCTLLQVTTIINVTSGCKHIPVGLLACRWCWWWGSCRSRRQ